MHKYSHIHKHKPRCGVKASSHQPKDERNALHWASRNGHLKVQPRLKVVRVYGRVRCEHMGVLPVCWTEIVTDARAKCRVCWLHSMSCVLCSALTFVCVCVCVCVCARVYALDLQVARGGGRSRHQQGGKTYHANDRSFNLKTKAHTCIITYPIFLRARKMARLHSTGQVVLALENTCMRMRIHLDPLQMVVIVFGVIDDGDVSRPGSNRTLSTSHLHMRISPPIAAHLMQTNITWTPYTPFFKGTSTHTTINKDKHTTGTHIHIQTTNSHTNTQTHLWITREEEIG